MSEELSGYELRVAVASASGWKVEINDNPQRHVVYEPDGTIYSVDADSPRLPPFESSIYAAWTLLEEWHNGKWHRQIKIRIATTSVKLREQTAICEIHDGETDEYGEGRCVVTESIQSAMAAAICRALVAAAEETL